MLVTRKEIQDRSYANVYGRFSEEETPLARLYYNLIEPFREDPVEALNLEGLRVEVASPGSDEKTQSEQVVNFAYNVNYLKHGGKVEDLAHDRFDDQPKTHTLVVCKEIGGRQLVLATSRVVCGPELEVFDFFETVPGEVWPHEKGESKKPGELGRFSLHPVYDFLKNVDDLVDPRYVSQQKRQVQRVLWPVGMDAMRSEGVEIPYFMLAPHVLVFLRKCGIIPQKINGIVPTTSPESLQTRQQYNEYWKPQRPIEEQPAIYMAPWEMALV